MFHWPFTRCSTWPALKFPARPMIAVEETVRVEVENCFMARSAETQVIAAISEAELALVS